MKHKFLQGNRLKAFIFLGIVSIVLLATCNVWGTFNNPNATITPSFSSSTATYTLTPGTLTNGTMTPATFQTVNAGASTAITATPNTGYVFSGWIANPLGNAFFLSSTSASTYVIITGSVSITPNFTISTASFSLTPGTLTNGSMIPATVQAVSAGVSTPITATPNTGYAFSGWTANPSANATFTNSANATTSVILTGNATIAASFSLTTATYTLTPGTTINGTMTPSTIQSVNAGASTIITATPNNGYTFSGWTANPSGNATFASSTYASTSVTLIGNATIAPTFSISTATYNVTYFANLASSGNVPIDSNNYQTGATVSVLGNTGNLARTGYTFAGWNTAQDGSGKTYNIGSSFQYSGNAVSLSPIWIANSLTFSTSGTSDITITGYSVSPTGQLSLPVGVSIIGDSAFMGCSNITSVSIPNGYSTISNRAFQGCSSLASITLPQTITSIGDFAFVSCLMTTINIPASVSTIGIEPFGFCTNLSTISVDASSQYFVSVSGVLFNKNLSVLIQAPTNGLTGLYSIQNSVTSIIHGAFTGCSQVTSIIVPNGVSSILSETFEGCTKLASISLPASVSTIDSGAFWNDQALMSLTVDAANNSFTSSGGVLFNKNGTTLVFVPSGLAAGTFSIPQGVASISASSFQTAFSLVTLNIPASVTSINVGAFTSGSVSNLITINVDSSNPSYSSIGGVLFDLAGASLIFFPTGKTGSYTIPASTTAIRTQAFEFAGISSLTIPSSIATIEQWAFYGCRNLANVYIQSSNPVSLASNAQIFFSCPSSLSIHVPTGSVNRYTSATGWSDYTSQFVSP